MDTLKPCTEPLPVSPNRYKTGDKITLSLSGERYLVTIKSTTIVGFEREYLVEYKDGSKRFVKENLFENQVN